MIRAEEVKQADIYLTRLDNKELNNPKDLIKALNLKWFRLCALYKIKDKDGRVVRFTPNEAQRQRYIDNHNRNVILKARQLGFTTFEMIDATDDCLFTDNFAAGCIAHTLDDAKDIFRNKIKFAYERLVESEWMAIFDLIGLAFPTPTTDKNEGYVFSNGSSIRVGVSYRGGTLQRLHVSEFGKICRKYPEKAQEIVTGAFEAVALNGVLTIESTAEGQEGYFYSYCKEAQDRKKQKKGLTLLDFRFHFFPWHENKDYQMDPKHVVIDSQSLAYFERLESDFGIKTTDRQRAWYVKKSDVLQDDMKREYPSTPDEAFEQSIDGAYYATIMAKIREKGQILKLPYDQRLPVYTFWDLGRNDSMAIWFMQYANNQYRMIDYYENSGESLQFYLRKLRKDYEYLYGTVYMPHDADIVDLSQGDNKSRRQIAEDAGFRVEVVPRVPDKLDAIHAVRDILPLCWFDEEKCAPGIKALDHYRKEWNDKMGCYKSIPRHDWSSHGNDAFQQMARGFRMYDGIDSYEPDYD